MSTVNTRRKARDLVLELLSDVNDRHQYRFFRLLFDFDDDVEMQVANDVIDQFIEHGAPVLSHSVRGILGENNGFQKVKAEVTYICKILHNEESVAKFRAAGTA